MRSSSPIGCIRLPEMSLNRSIQGEVGPRNIKRSKSDTTLQNQNEEYEVDQRRPNLDVTKIRQWRPKIGHNCPRTDGSVQNQTKRPKSDAGV